MSALHDLLDDSVRDEPPLAVDAAAAWTAGRARRRSRLPRALAAAAVVLALLALVLPAAPVAPVFARGQAVQGYPEHVGRQAWVRDLPERPGPLAAVVHGTVPSLLERVTERLRTEPAAEGTPAEWHAVTASGRRWRLPGIEQAGEYPALSPDGRLLGSLAGPSGPYVVRDLVTGEQTRFPQVGANRGDVRTPYFVPIQTPLHWAPDGRRLALGFARAGTTASDGVVLDVDTGEVTEVRSAGSLLGWTSASSLAWLDGRDQDGPHHLVVTDVTDGRVLERRTLRPDADAGRLPVNQYGLVSGDGRWVVLTGDGAFGEAAGTLWFDRATGRQAGSTPVEGELAWSPVALPGSADVVRVRRAADGTLVSERVGRDGSVQEVSTAAAGLQPFQVTWAGQALTGEVDRDLLDRLPVPRELLVAVLAGAAVVLLRRRRTP